MRRDEGVTVSSLAVDAGNVAPGANSNDTEVDKPCACVVVGGRCPRLVGSTDS